ncbi:MAG: hypothetical protein KGL63_01640 [Betaproteobacteria bacterium]|nr:hypothetical protein [Betaproteobacteria bacterium]
MKPPKCFSEGIALLLMLLRALCYWLGQKNPLGIASIPEALMSRLSSKNATMEKARRHKRNMP